MVKRTVRSSTVSMVRNSVPFEQSEDDGHGFVGLLGLGPPTAPPPQAVRTMLAITNALSAKNSFRRFH